MTETDKLARILRNRADTGCAVHGQQWAEGMRCAANIIEHESASAQPASAADDWNPSVAEVAAWTVRNGLDGVLVPSEARTAIDDARSMHMLAPQPPSAMAQESGE